MNPLYILDISPLPGKYPANKYLLFRGCCLICSWFPSLCRIQCSFLTLGLCPSQIHICVWCEVGVEVHFFALIPSFFSTIFGKQFPLPSELPWHLVKIQEGHKPAAVSTLVSFC